ncbi:flavodoxin family protein [Celeribacter baekdonensis]|uniref:NADPH-dependent FMN reductase n=1 Tax=Celeribacter baekdonensis TaxID=875171 RepID=A0A2R4M340_9RHOB|nr:flavodoxin family protein [Celeribacter baekdonensis]AVW91640.1 NADPH-dependent FMN reductase [Celeribacter baekdonensis]
MAQIEIVYFSGYGHTVKQAQAVAAGAGASARLWRVSDEGTLPEEAWMALDQADAILFGSPTYMGGPAWQFKRMADESSKRWMTQSWDQKLMGGFTNSASTNGDKAMTILFFATLAAQHGGLWVSLGQMPANALASGPEDQNWSGGALGPLATSPSDSTPEQGPLKGDLDSARAYGERVLSLLSKA